MAFPPCHKRAKKHEREFYIEDNSQPLAADPLHFSRRWLRVAGAARWSDLADAEVFVHTMALPMAKAGRIAFPKEKNPFHC